MKTTKIIVLDNNGETLDRYTFVDRKTGEMLASSENGLGVFMYAGNIKELGWRNIKDFLSNSRHIGRKIDFNSVSVELQNMVIDYFN
jgi:hypothetical protein